MTQIKNIFAKGTIQKDLDSRFVSPDELIDAQNAIVITSEGSNAGVLKNVTGNVKKTNLNIEELERYSFDCRSPSTINRSSLVEFNDFAEEVLDLERVDYLAWIKCQAAVVEDLLLISDMSK